MMNSLTQFLLALATISASIVQHLERACSSHKPEDIKSILPKVKVALDNGENVPQLVAALKGCLDANKGYLHKAAFDVLASSEAVISGHREVRDHLASPAFGLLLSSESIKNLAFLDHLYTGSFEEAAQLVKANTGIFESTSPVKRNLVRLVLISDTPSTYKSQFSTFYSSLGPENADVRQIVDDFKLEGSVAVINFDEISKYLPEKDKHFLKDTGTLRVPYASISMPYTAEVSTSPKKKAKEPSIGSKKVDHSSSLSDSPLYTTVTRSSRVSRAAPTGDSSLIRTSARGDPSRASLISTRGGEGAPSRISARRIDPAGPKSLQDQFIAACSAGDLDEARRVYLEALNKGNQLLLATAMYNAISSGHDKVFFFILDKKAGQLNKDEVEFIYDSCPSPSIVGYILQTFPDIKTDDCVFTACREGRVEVLQTLMIHGANISLCTQYILENRDLEKFNMLVSLAGDSYLEQLDDLAIDLLQHFPGNETLVWHLILSDSRKEGQDRGKTVLFLIEKKEVPLSVDWAKALFDLYGRDKFDAFFVEAITEDLDLAAVMAEFMDGPFLAGLSFYQFLDLVRSAHLTAGPDVMMEAACTNGDRDEVKEVLKRFGYDQVDYSQGDIFCLQKGIKKFTESGDLEFVKFIKKMIKRFQPELQQSQKYKALMTTLHANSPKVIQEFEASLSEFLSEGLADRFYTFDIITDEINSGVSGTVYSAKDSFGMNMVAVKIIDLEHERNLEAVRNEIQIMRMLNDKPNVMGCKDVYIDGNELWIVMELMSNDLAKLVKSISTKEDEEKEQLVGYVAVEILKGLDELHKLDIIHRDIKPENVLWSYDGGLKIADFGTCSQNPNVLKVGFTSDPPHTETFAMIGTQPYRAPEFIAEGVSYTRKVDIYAVGITLFQLATGQPPWQTEDAVVMNSKSKVNIILRGANLPQNLTYLIMRCLDPNPETRPSAASLLASQCLQPESISTRREFGAILPDPRKPYEQHLAEKLNESKRESRYKRASAFRPSARLSRLSHVAGDPAPHSRISAVDPRLSRMSAVYRPARVSHAVDLSSFLSASGELGRPSRRGEPPKTGSASLYRPSAARFHSRMSDYVDQSSSLTDFFDFSGRYPSSTLDSTSTVDEFDALMGEMDTSPIGSRSNVVDRGYLDVDDYKVDFSEQDEVDLGNDAAFQEYLKTLF